MVDVWPRIKRETNRKTGLKIWPSSAWLGRLLVCLLARLLSLIGRIGAHHRALLLRNGVALELGTEDSKPGVREGDVADVLWLVARPWLVVLL